MSLLGFTPLIVSFSLRVKPLFIKIDLQFAVCRTSAGKCRRQEPIRDSPDSEEEDDSIYMSSRYRCMSSTTPERFKDAHDWSTECLVGTLQGTKRSNKAPEGLLYGIKFDDGNATAWYPRIYEWGDYCSGPDMTGTAQDRTGFL
jgi:hypothetical protein